MAIRHDSRRMQSSTDGSFSGFMSIPKRLVQRSAAIWKAVLRS
jgi:hypothetical protein